MRTPPPEFDPDPVDLEPLRPRRRLVRALAERLVGRPWQADDLVREAACAIEAPGPWVAALVDQMLAAFPAAKGRPPASRLAAWLGADGRLPFPAAKGRPPASRLAAWLGADGRLALINARTRLRLADGVWPEPLMWPRPGPAEAWPLPPLTTPAALADWLRLSPDALDGLADVQGRGRRIVDGPLARYVYRWRPKAHGRARLIEEPRPRLKAVQRRLLDEVIGRIPPHDAAHGFRPGRSVATFAAPHVGRAVVIRLDLCDFFPSITAPRLVALFLTAGYPEPVARRLAGLCTNRVPPGVWTMPDAPTAAGPEGWRARKRFETPHLPQGAPSSPALANLVAYRLDARLAGLAAALGASYTRYADDLCISGDTRLARAADRFVVGVMATALECGFEVQPRKTRIMPASARQHAAGVVVNTRLNVARDEFDRLKATLHNCLRHGPTRQNRSAHPAFRAHLAGRVAHVAALNPDRGARLRRIFDAIAWDDDSPP